MSAVAAVLTALAWLAAPPAEGDASWPQWGGADRDFHASAGPIAASWPEGGPHTLWSRELGPGYSAILYENGRLYTMYRSGSHEVVTCLDAGDGATIWELRFESPRDVDVPQLGSGPRATPLIAGDRLFAVGVGGRLLALGKADGVLLWSRDLWAAPFDGTPLPHGYSSSPLAYRGTVIVPVGGKAGIVAFDAGTGEVVWRSAPFRNSYSSPRLLRLAGEDHVVTFMAEELVGLDPLTGALRWRVEHANQWGHNITPPVAIGDDILFISSPQAGARGIRVTRAGTGVAVEELWSSRRIQFHHATAVAVGDWIYGSIGTASPAFVAAINGRTGEIAWRERGLARANCVTADGKLVILSEDGVLALARVTPDAFVVLARTRLLDRPAWTVPTIVGGTLYVRDTGRILAVALDEPSPSTRRETLRTIAPG